MPSTDDYLKFIRPRAARVAWFTLSYALFGVLWILLSDRLVELTIPAGQQPLVQSFKGLLFIALSTLYIFWVLMTKTRRLTVAYRQVRSQNEKIHQFSRRLMNVQDTERAQLSEEFHDNLGQSLTALRFTLAPVLERASVEERDEINDTLNDIARSVTAISRNLYPKGIGIVGLSATLQDYVEQVNKTASAQITFTDESGTQRRHETTKFACFRIVQEAVRNAMRHGDAMNIAVKLVAARDHVIVTIEDDGTGFDVAKVRDQQEGVGVYIMEDRARNVGGSLAIVSEPGTGTRVTAILPLEGEYAKIRLVS